MSAARAGLFLLLAPWALAVPGALEGARAEVSDTAATVVELRLEGPLSTVVLEAGGRPTHILGELAPGEQRSLGAPLSTWAAARRAEDLAGRLALRVEPEQAGGRVSVLAYAPLRPDLWSSGFPTSLGLRSRPPLRPALPRLDLTRLALAAGAFLAVLALRRRPLAALSAGVLLSALLLLLPAAPLPGPAVQILEGDARSAQWAWVRGALDRIELPPGSLPWDDVLGEGEETRWVVELEPGRRERWFLEGAGRSLFLLEPLLEPPLLERSRAGEALAQCWTREPGDAWRWHGGWDRGAALPPPREGGAPPPGWLAAGLPQGLSVLLGRLAEEGPQGEPRWIRVVGWP